MSDNQNNGGGVPPNPVNPPASPEVGGGAATTPEKKSRWRWDPKGKRNIVYIAIVVLVAGAAMLLMTSGSQREEGKQSSIPPEAGYGDAPAVAGKEDRDAFSQSERKRLDQAQQSGQSAVEGSLGGASITQTEYKAPPAQPAPVQPVQQPAQQAQRPVPDNQKLADYAAQAERYMKSWGLRSADNGSADSARSRPYLRTLPKQDASQATGQAQGGAAASGVAKAAGQDADESPVVVEAFATAYGAELISTFDSDAPGIVRARLQSGPLAGAVLIGSGRRAKDGVQVAFSNCSYKGKPFKCAAIGLDETTSSDVIEGRYNGRYAERFVFPVLADGIKAYAGARAQTGTQVVLISTPTATGVGIGAQQTPPPTAEQARSAMESAMADQASKALKAGNVQDQVVLDMHKYIGVMFIDSVTEADLSKSRK